MQKLRKVHCMNVWMPSVFNFFSKFVFVCLTLGLTLLSTETGVKICGSIPLVINYTASLEVHHQCSSQHDCTHLKGYVWCNPFGNKCECERGTFMLSSSYKCVKVARLHDVCESPEQCKKWDPLSTCTLTYESNILSSACKCDTNYQEEIGFNKTTCVIQRSFFPKNGIHQHFDTRDSVPILMGCVAAGLALLACSAGIAQLLRKRHQQFRSGPVNHEEETSNLQRISMVSTRSTRPTTTTITTQPAEEISLAHINQEDLPPSYEEAIKYSSPVTLLPHSEKEEQQA
ncbi:uncharacterized protein LOC106461945 isoform X1 [Limulus polyphemus]|uniref:Uncharacterized protein LOC106461945 isoform X1 n=1 Tax=Limulus polyphemus TaxID=6850 RepID=A0ABM1SMA0_LIMPO|nr:uncharacterized protein LOC106461945 isoform X1 [Limulus polyphemus]XP_022244756.1 uncharacterized protein LOC106461945 isoform X1 [Limulus polyphemus]